MDTLFDKAFVKVKLLSTIFRANESRYLSPAYQEAEVRKDFIDKFFAALGWDVNHDEQTDPYAQEVNVERGVETRTVDYAFFLKPNYRDTHFLVEAKKPSTLGIGVAELGSLGGIGVASELITFGKRNLYSIRVK